MVVEMARPPVEVVAEFVRVAHRVVWCSMATVDRLGRPRSRVVHPYWEQTGDGLIGWVTARPTPLKRAHLARTPYVSCSYWDPMHEIAVAECEAEYAGSPENRRHVWELFGAADPPLGFDLRILGVDEPLDERFTVVRLRPWRLRTAELAWRRTGSAIRLMGSGPKE
ncbi:pyridoxamine 5'-phosphate oxidase [Amycolatopsis albispora]|uniref:Pyridoxamine 5'-phosphate oxidase n=2 Tax=Amycolatopsis albispora TaxID=1804986 RepID=A0A344LJ94_9PSEU|nr:pyridoxamine 5'-phosphate oxidase [Amycolatopsis albispora]AXB48118.1 pyridoxamine 5'-phosphate oxidase [Amycolatopsis albispora]